MLWRDCSQDAAGSIPALRIPFIRTSRPTDSASHTPRRRFPISLDQTKFWIVITHFRMNYTFLGILHIVPNESEKRNYKFDTDHFFSLQIFQNLMLQTERDCLRGFRTAGGSALHLHSNQFQAR